MTYKAFIPARSGSKRLPGKNIKDLNGKPLFVWTLEACRAIDKINEIIISTDSDEYWEIAKQYVDDERLKLDFRNADGAGDNVKIFDYLKNNYIKIFGDNSEGSFILALPTAPLRNHVHLSEAMHQYESVGKPIFSASEYGFPVSFSFYLDDEKWAPFFDECPMLTGNTRSQNQKTAYHPNGAIYIRRIADLHNPGLQTLYIDSVPYIMSRHTSIDIDDEHDFKIAEYLMKELVS